MTYEKLLWTSRCLLASLLLLSAVSASAQQKPDAGAAEEPAPPPRIAIVNVEFALTQSTAVQTARTQLTQITQTYKKEIDEEEAGLRKLEQELQQQRTILAPEAFAKRREEFQQKAAKLQQKARAVRQAMDEGFKSTMEQIQSVLFEEVAKLAKELEFNIVIPSSQIIVAIEAFDITQQATDRLNARLPEVKLSMEQKLPDAGSQAQPAPAKR